jgi:hypothetical protein
MRLHGLSANTLIAPWKIEAVGVHVQPMDSNLDKDGQWLKIYRKPVYTNDDGPGHIYICCVDVGQGQNQDYSVCQVIDISENPLATGGRRTVITHQADAVGATVVRDLGRYYNNAFLFFEINSEGPLSPKSVADELDYENIIYIFPHPKRGQQISAGYHKRARFGLKVTETTKRTGCTGLKSLIETDKLLINDYDTVRELTTFVAKMSKNGSHAKTYEAEVGNHDDTVSPLVLLGWLTLQQGFENYVGLSMRQLLTEGHDPLTFDEPYAGIMGDLEQHVRLSGKTRKWTRHRG